MQPWNGISWQLQQTQHCLHHPALSQSGEYGFFMDKDCAIANFLKCDFSFFLNVCFWIISPWQGSSEGCVSPSYLLGDSLENQCKDCSGSRGMDIPRIPDWFGLEQTKTFPIPSLKMGTSPTIPSRWSWNLLSRDPV